MLTFKQSNFVAVNNTANPAVAYTSNLTAGSLLICLASTNVGGTTITAVSDTSNGAWTAIGTSQANGPGTGFFQAYYFNGSIGGVTPTVTATCNGQVNNLLILEFTGQKSLDTFTYTAGAGGSSGPFNASLTTAVNGEACIALLLTGTASNWTLGGTPTPTGVVTGPFQRQAALSQVPTAGAASVSYTADRGNAWSGLAWVAFSTSQAANQLMLVGVGT